MTATQPSQASLTHTLLVELLAHQFAFPVRWIETQKTLMQDAGKEQRIVEIGPSQVLATMAKKTAAKEFGLRDQLHSTKRTILSSASDGDRLLYNYADKEPPAPATSAASAPEVTPVPVAPAVKPVAEHAAVLPAIASVSVPDKAVSASDIVLAITAQKLKKPFDNLPVTKSVRELSGGKSTLQNELIGDFTAEFGQIPDGSEDTALQALGDALDHKSSGTIGKHASALISKLTASKMPGGFNTAAIKNHLETKWGLQSGRQSTVLLFALTMEPSSRLADDVAAKAWLDSIVSHYSAFENISLMEPGTAVADASASIAAAVVDTKSLDVVRAEQKKVLTEQFKVLAKTLGQDDGGDAQKQVVELIHALEKSEDDLRLWSTEFGDGFAQGISPLFDANKARVYDSWWNWARQDVLALIHGISCGRFTEHTEEVQPLLSSIRNRLDQSCEDILRRNGSLLANTGLERLLRRESMPNSTLRPRFTYTAASMAPKTIMNDAGELHYEEIVRSANDTYSKLVRKGHNRIPYAHIRTRNGERWEFNSSHTDTYLEALDLGMRDGICFANKTVLVTGAGPNSIGADVVKGLIRGGASVIVTTSREPSASAKFYQAMYQENAAPGSSLRVAPFNAASRTDVSALVEWIYSADSGVNDLDFVVPFAAIPQVGQVDGLSATSELAHRAMLVNLLRLLGEIKKEKESRQLYGRPTNVLLPLSPNHGTFGGDGLYGESKLGLETVFNRCKSENWTNWLTVTGVVIGWTRGTGLMSGNNLAASAIEAQGVMTFSQAEMSYNILCLMTAEIAALSDDEPVYADISGGLHLIDDIKGIIAEDRAAVRRQSEIRKALVAERQIEQRLLQTSSSDTVSKSTPPERKARARISLEFPELKDYTAMIEGTKDLRGMPDLERTIVIVGFSELGPWGSARTRWSMESNSKLSDAALIELAWMMGIVKHHKGILNGNFVAGWIDAESQQVVHEAEFRERYESKILQHTGLRFIEPEGLGGNTDPRRKEFMQEVVLEDDLPPFEASKEMAETFVRRHGPQLVSVQPIPDTDDCKVHIKSGAQLFVPKAIEADRLVAGQLPKGWDPIRYGIPADIISQVDPVVVYALCCLAEAILMAGLQDPLELYQHIHVSELANCLGTGAGSLLAMRGIYRDRFLDRPVQNDILQESYLNAIGAWSNMLLLASSGPIKTPTGTCATSIESLDAGCEAIKAGKAKVAIVGGSDDFQDEMSYEFGNMKATCSTKDELKKGRTPAEMSRPTASSRAGFVESAGCGVQIIMSADLAIRMGLPIYGIVGCTHMAGDKVGRSVPAPGQGILTAGKESPDAARSPLLDLDFRRHMLSNQLRMIDSSLATQLKSLQKGECPDDKVLSARAAAATLAKDARHNYSNDIRAQNPGISPIRSALAAWGLTVDDLAVASFHGTSTQANEKNEANVVNTIMTHLGRSTGNPLMVVCQKHLTGHTKGAAGAFMLNGGLQVLQKGTVPGNRNADNIDPVLRQYEHLAFPSTAISTAGVKAFMLTSFGFGQKGGLAVIVHPQHIFSAIDSATYNKYRELAQQRQKKANARFARGLVSNSLFQAKTVSPWEAAGERAVFLDPAARVSSNDPAKLTFNAKMLHPSPCTTTIELPSLRPTVHSHTETEAFVEAHSNVASVGVDVEAIEAIPTHNANFVDRNFTPAEQTYCDGASDPRASYAGRWVAKEAAFKSLQTTSHGAGTSMREIEVLPNSDGVPKVMLHGKAKAAAVDAGIEHIEVSISHSQNRAMAIAVALV